MVLAMNGAEFGELGASYSSAVASLQNALVALGRGIGDPTLMKVAIDGIMGPKTAAATNRALTVHLGAGQAPSNLRTGSLPQGTITSMAAQITALITTEIARRGFSAPSTVKAPAKKAVAARPAATPAFVPTPAVPAQLAPAAASPVYRVPAAVDTDSDLGSVMKWAAIGVGVVALGGVAYYLATRDKGGRGGGIRARTGVPGGALSGPTQRQMFYRAGRDRAEADATFLHLVNTGLTRDELAKLIKKRPSLWKRYESWLPKLPAKGVGGFGRSDRIDNNERELWIRNDEGLWNWYQQESRRQKGGMRAFIKRNRAEIDAAIRGVRDREPPKARFYGGLGNVARADEDALETIIDRAPSVRDVFESISSIADGKAEHLESNWQDTAAAREWSRFARAVDRFGAKVKIPGETRARKG